MYRGIRPPVLQYGGIVLQYGSILLAVSSISVFAVNDSVCGYYTTWRKTTELPGPLTTAVILLLTLAVHFSSTRVNSTL